MNSADKLFAIAIICASIAISGVAVSFSIDRRGDNIEASIKVVADRVLDVVDKKLPDATCVAKE